MAGGVIIAVTGSNPFKAYYALLQGGGLAPKSSYASYKSMLTDFMSYVNYFTPDDLRGTGCGGSTPRRTV